MKKLRNLMLILLTLATLIVCFGTLSCGRFIKKVNNPTKKQTEVKKDSTKEKQVPDTLKNQQPKEDKSFVKVEDGHFALIVKFIEKHGFIFKNNGVPCNQYTFIDSKGTRHAFMTRKTGSDGYPSVKEPVNSIIVYAYKDFKIKGKNQENFYGYSVYPDKVGYLICSKDSEGKDFDDMANGYKDFLKLVKKNSK